MTDVARIESWEGFESLRPVWDKLIASDEHPTIFKTFEWLDAWWHAFGRDHKLLVLVINSGGNVVGVAPLMLSERSVFGRRSRTVRFIGTPEADYCDFIGRDKEIIVKRVIDYLLERREEWTTVDLSQISERSKSVAVLRESFASQYHPYRIRVIETCPMFLFDGDEQERASFNPKRGKTLRNHFNYLNKEGSLELTETRDADRIERHLYSLFHYHVVRWSKTATPSRFLNPQHRDFYLRLSRKLAPIGRVSLLVLKRQGLPIAYKFNFDYGGTIFHNTPTHSLFYDTRSPGAVINDLSRRYYVKKGNHCLDYVRGAQPHKKGLCNRRYDNYQVKIYGRRLNWYLEAAYERLKQFAAVRGLLRNPSFRKVKDKIKHSHTSYGTRKLIIRGFGYLWRSIIDRPSMALFEDAGVPVPSFDLPEKTTIRKLKKRDVVEIASFYGVREKSKRHEVFKDRLETGGDCFAVCRRESLTAVLWGLTGQVSHSRIERLHRLKDNEVLLCDGLVSPVSEDGEKLYAALLAHMVRLYREGGRQVLAASAPGDRVAADAITVARFRKIRILRSLKLLGIRIK
jgi:CelD/BcsL family acetyltransferase involved in cellulose biosynthesis